VRRLLKEMGYDVLVVNPRQIRLIAESTWKCDRLDAEILARLSRMGEGFLRPIYQSE
jgi:transposase